MRSCRRAARTTAPPDADFADMKAMCVEAKYRSRLREVTTQALLATMGRACPLDRAFFHEVPNMVGVYRMQCGIFETIPLFPWDQLYNLTGVIEGPGGVPEKKMRKALGLGSVPPPPLVPPPPPVEPPPVDIDEVHELAELGSGVLWH